MWIPVAMTICIASPVTGDVACDVDADWPAIPVETESICEARMRTISVSILAKAIESGMPIPLVSLTPECREQPEGSA